MTSSPYPAYLPAFDTTKYEALTPFTHVDPAARALEQERQGKDALEYLSGGRVAAITPDLGDEVFGVDLTTLDSDARDQLALQAARRGVVVFRDQEAFLAKDPDWLRDWGQHFGKLHIHPHGPVPKDFPEMYVIYHSPDANFNFEVADSITSTLWHSDISYELQPAGVATLFLFAQPPTGNDTLFASTVVALKKFSPEFVSFLRTLDALHSGMEHAHFSRTGKRSGIVRREPVQNIHPVVRRHPVTNEESLYVGREFTRKIVGLKQEESDLILNFLCDHIAKGGDFQARIQWKPNSVVIWDNRVVAHSGVVDNNHLRHGGRITAQAERPIPARDAFDSKTE